jgi:large subunit ribosomal protein L21e
MVRSSRGFRAGTRKKLGQKLKRPTITKFLEKFKIGQRVIIILEPSSQRGMPHPRFKGKMGKIVGKRGKSYIVEIKDINKTKKLISRPEHLKNIE